MSLTLSSLSLHLFLQDGMGNLRITERGLKLEGDSEFLQPLYAKEIQSRPVSAHQGLSAWCLRDSREDIHSLSHTMSGRNNISEAAVDGWLDNV